MNISGIVVRLESTIFEPGLAALGALPGVRLHHLDRQTSRVVLTQEAASSDEQELGLRRIQQLPGVAHAELVYHFFEDDPDTEQASGPGLVQLGGRP